MKTSEKSADRAPGLPCVHCGLCLDTCPTYRVLGNEADSPRGRIYLMEAVRAGTLELDRQTAQHLDGCLGCLACETACPSGVSYGERIEEFRPRLANGRALPLKDRIWRRVVRTTSGNPEFMTAALRAVEKLDSLGLGSIRKRIPGLDVLPADADPGACAVPPIERSRIPAPSSSKRRAILLTGCVADIVRPDITRAAVEVLHRNGVEVVPVPEQSCCGALALHTGDPERARASARANVEAFSPIDADFIVSTASGCGLMMREYGALLAGGPLESRAQATSAKVRDVSEVLAEVGMIAPNRVLQAGRIVYHDACHLLHGAAVSAAPRKVLETATGHPVEDLGENELCCGSAGTYNVEHPRMAKRLGDRKAELTAAVEADVVAVANVGCMLQIKAALERSGSQASTAHPVELLAEAYAAEND